MADHADYYAVLGVERDAAISSIKAAYRRLASAHHPDRNPTDGEATTRFQSLVQAYDVLGDAVSTAARIESKCKEYGCLLLVGENTYEQTKNDFFYLKVDDLAVKGKSVGIGIWTVLDNIRPAWKTAQRKHEQMHEDYKAQKFDDAIKKCKMLHDHFDHKMEGYYNMWIERCEYMKTQDLPKDWNGVFIATTK